MHRKLIIKAFEKARDEVQRKGVNKPSNNSLAKLLSDFISNERNTPIGERRLRDYYNASVHTHTTHDIDINITQLSVVIGLCNYLGHENYEAFVSKYIPESKKKPLKKRVFLFDPTKIKYENWFEKDTTSKTDKFIIVE